MNFLCPNHRCLALARALGAVPIVLLLAGCGRDDVQVYRISKDQAAQQASTQPDAMPPGHPDMGATAPGLKWKSLPEGWQEAPAGQMRVAAFRIQAKNGKQADLGVIALPGFMGHDLENVNRWRGAVGLAPIGESDLAKLAQAVQIGGEAGQMYDQAGENPGSGEKSRIIVAVAHHEGIAWFFKMNGDDEVVSAQKPALVDFLKSVSFEGGGGGQMELPPSHPPIAGADAASPQPTPAAAPNENRPAWQVPAGWQETPGGPFLLAKFIVNGTESPQTTVNISMSQGAGGGVLMNVNRWRGQLGLPPLSEAELAKEMTSVGTEGGKAMFVQLTGTDAKSGQKAALVAAIVPRNDQTFFYKLMGSASVVQSQKDAFTQFVKSVKY